MKKRTWGVLAGLTLGIAAALTENAGQMNPLALLLKPWAALGNLLRGWSLSGAAGNAAAWAAATGLSLLPVAYILIARRKRRLPGDWVWLLTAAGVFSALFLLVNPTLALHPMLAQSVIGSSPELTAMGPAALAGSLLLLGMLMRWSYGLNERRLIRWAQAILAGVMAMIAFGLGSSLTGGIVSFVQSQPAADFFSSMSQTAQSLHPADAAASLTLEMISLIPSLFLLLLLNSALTLVSSLAGGWFTEKAESNAALMAVRARQALIAAAGCMAARNILTLMLCRVISNASFAVEVPTTELLTSCAAMLLAKMLSAACRVKRDNDLMI